MTKLHTPTAMLFDLDGTLFRSESILEPAYDKTFEVLKAEGHFVGETPPVAIMLSCLGMVLDEIWERIWPGMPEQTKRYADVLFMRFQLEQLEQGNGELYAGVAEHLRAWRQQGIRLFVASNGQEQYVADVVRTLGIPDVFEDLYSAGRFGTKSKVDLVRLLMEKYGLEAESTWMVGDRSSDVEAGVANGLTVVGCRYADFGDASELAGSAILVDSFDALAAAVATSGA
jgi:HAD superfamily hydrolase (TIGR01549 family)